MNIKYNFEQIKKKIFQRLFHYLTKDVFQIKSIGKFSEQSNVILLSMLQESDLQMYLLAVKSFLRYIIINKVVIVCDPSLTAESKRSIKKHIAKVEFLDVQDYRHDSIPSGGCWERLYAISHLTRDYYVIQMDADILTIKEPREVILAMDSNAPFIMGTNPEFQQLPIEKMTELVCNWSKQWETQKIKLHIQTVAEINMTDLVKPLGYDLYTKGCAGFAGFSKGSITPSLVQKMSQIFYNKLGQQWDNWGTEQFMSNILLSNLADVQVLSIEKYNASKRYSPQSILIHFLGERRFAEYLYIKLAKRVISELRERRD